MQRLEGDRRLRFYDSYKRQNRLARRIGLPMLRTVFFIFVASLLLQLTVAVALRMSDRGWLAPPSLEKYRLKDG